MSGKADRLSAHKGLATWGERLVPLESFRSATAKHGQRLSEAECRQEVAAFTRPLAPSSSADGPLRRVVVFGGVYSNHLALRALLDESERWGAEAVYCLGDLGGFGPSPEKVWPLLLDGNVKVLQGNYEESLSSGREDCNCGYADPRDNHFAELSYRYTEAHCSPEFKAWMGELPKQRRLRIGGRELLLVHGSPRRINEFLFHSTAPIPFLEVLLDRFRCDGLLCTHTGLHWVRHLPSGRIVANVGAIGRPANDGRPEVWYCRLEAEAEALHIEVVPLPYDQQALAAEMRQEGLPEEFVETTLSGWWTTCLEVLPAVERGRSRY